MPMRGTKGCFHLFATVSIFGSILGSILWQFSWAVFEAISWPSSASPNTVFSSVDQYYVYVHQHNQLFGSIFCFARGSIVGGILIQQNILQWWGGGNANWMDWGGVLPVSTPRNILGRISWASCRGNAKGTMAWMEPVCIHLMLLAVGAWCLVHRTFQLNLEGRLTWLYGAGSNLSGGKCNKQLENSSEEASGLQTRMLTQIHIGNLQILFSHKR